MKEFLYATTEFKGSKGVYIAFLDADDFGFPIILKLQIN
jgi:hypothetical protein